MPAFHAAEVNTSNQHLYMQAPGVPHCAQRARPRPASPAMSSAVRRVLVTGAAGRVGKEVVARLAKAGDFVVRAATRGDGAYARSLGAHEVVRFDLEDASTWGPAMEGVTHLFSSTQDKYIAQHMDFAKFCGEHHAGSLQHIVRVSCFGAETNTAAYDDATHVSRSGAAIPLMLQHYWWSEECFLRAGFGDRLTSLRGNFYMNHLLKNELGRIREEGAFASPLGDTKNSFVACNDMGEAAAVVLAEGAARHGDKAYDICGAAPQSMAEVAATLTEALATPLAREVVPDVAGKAVRYEPQDVAQFEADFGATRAEFFEYLRNGFYSRSSPCFYNLTGHRPLSYYEYLTTEGAAGDTGLAELFSDQGALYTKGQDLFKGLQDVKR